MKLTPKNKLGYLQVTISVLITLCAMSLTYCQITMHHGSSYWYKMNYSLSNYTILDDTLFTIVFTIFILLQLVNIYFQSQKRNRNLSTITAVASFIIIIASRFLIEGIIYEEKSSYNNYSIDLACGFYFMLLLIIAQIVTSWLPDTLMQRSFNVVTKFLSDTQQGTDNSVNKTTENTLPLPAKTNKEIAKNKEKIEPYFAQTITGRMNLVKHEREMLRLEKENLANEIARLKESLKKHDNIAK